jgi:hypothetical protein
MGRLVPLFVAVQPGSFSHLCPHQGKARFCLTRTFNAGSPPNKISLSHVQDRAGRLTLPLETPIPCGRTGRSYGRSTRALSPKAAKD